MAGHHEVQRLQQLLTEVEPRLIRELEDIRHGIAIPLDRQSGLLVRIHGVFPHFYGKRVVQLRVIALDAVRALDGACKLDPP